MTNKNTHNQFFDIDKMMSDNELILAYRNEIDEQTVQHLLAITELKLAQSGEEKKLRKRVFNILVECLQNIVNHAESTDAKSSEASLLLIGRNKTNFFIITGNRILNEKVEKLEAKINEINSWDHSAMRDIYSDKLGKSEYSEKGGAGLGLIDIYKRSGRKILYNIDPINDKVSFLSFHITIDPEN
jgi:hypothetical protein